MCLRIIAPPLMEILITTGLTKETRTRTQEKEAIVMMDLTADTEQEHQECTMIHMLNQDITITIKDLGINVEKIIDSAFCR